MSKYAIFGIFLQCLCYSLLFAGRGEAQKMSLKDVQISIELDDLNIESSFQKIEALTGFKFSYKRSMFKEHQKLNLRQTNLSLANLLRNIARDAELQFRRIDGTIHVQKRNKSTDKEFLTDEGIFDREISGKVTDEEGGALPGVNVTIRGSVVGTVTDTDGKYKLNVPDDATQLIFSYVGYLNETVDIGNRSVIDLRMVQDISQLQEIVVTALGVERERKSLGYSVETLNNAGLQAAREPNLVNALSGQIAGVQIVKGSNGPAGSSKIVLRGFSSLTGDNQPLIVVDGVPLNNFTGAESNDFWGSNTTDFGNGLGDLNAEDIESMSVLKGASAAALYGSRAGNGVILITTKSGKSKKGLGVSYSLTTGVQSIFMTPDLQNSFAQGDEGVYDGDQESPSSASWGPKIEGQTVKDFRGNDATLQAFDNIENFYQDGFSQSHNLSFQKQLNESSSIYTSANYFKDESNVPGAVLERLNLLTRTVSKFGVDDNWTIDAKVQYINSVAENRPNNGQGTSNSYLTLITFPSSLDIRMFEDATDEFGNQTWYDENTSQINPYWSINNMLNKDTRDRFLLNGAVKHEITHWLSTEFRFGADIFSTTNEGKTRSGSPASETGAFSSGKRTFIERNFSTLIVASKDNLIGKLGGSVSLGGNLMSTKTDATLGNTGPLLSPNLFSLNNAQGTLSITESFSRKKINSAYGILQLNYDGYLFVDITGRNDWSSSLSKENRSFFYPSVSASFVFSDLIEIGVGDLPNWFNFAKIRASYAEVGNDLDPFRLVNAFSIGRDGNGDGNPTATTGDVLFNPDVQSELIKSLEFGFEGHFFNNRLGLDITWYKSNATNQLLEIPLDPLSGFNRKIINAGDIQNKGLEIGVNANILKNESNGFSWDVRLNYTNNENTIEELDDEVTQFNLGGFDNLAILAEVGGNYGVIWGTKYRRVEDEADPHFGKIIVDGSGIPLGTDDKFVLGSQVPDALIGIANSFTYKNLSLSFLISGSIGGEIFSGTNRNLQNAGLAEVTVVNGAREDVVFDGVVDDGAENYSVNTTAVSPQNLWVGITARTGNLGITEANVYDATNVRLRNISLNYRLPAKWLENTPFQGVQVGTSMNNVWMISSDLNGVDPESVYATSSNAVGFENLSSPTIRTLFFNIAVTF